jgi:hypothetical protein
VAAMAARVVHPFREVGGRVELGVEVEGHVPQLLSLPQTADSLRQTAILVNFDENEPTSPRRDNGIQRTERPTSPASSVSW